VGRPFHPGAREADTGRRFLDRRPRPMRGVYSIQTVRSSQVGRTLLSGAAARYPM
jgi:hypothetical protein